MGLGQQRRKTAALVGDVTLTKTGRFEADFAA
jgi:hypothetical protein